MMQPILLKHHLKLLFNKLSSTVTIENMGYFMFTKDHPFKELCQEPHHHSSIIGGANECLHLLGDIVDSHKDVFMEKRGTTPMKLVTQTSKTFTSRI